MAGWFKVVAMMPRLIPVKEQAFKYERKGARKEGRGEGEREKGMQGMWAPP